LAFVQRQGRFLSGEGRPKCSDHTNSSRSQGCGAVGSCSARFMRWLVRPPMPRISIRANRRRGCLRIAARRVIAARPVSPGGARVPLYSSSCRSITRPVRTRPRNSLLIWPRSTSSEAADRGRPPGSRRVLQHRVRPNRRHQIEIVDQLERFRAKWKPVRVKKTRQKKEVERSPRRFNNGARLRSARPRWRPSGSGPRQGE
jgi:hypothetical protein